MAEWLERIVEEVDRQYDELPSWKRREEQSSMACESENGRSSSTTREPRHE